MFSDKQITKEELEKINKLIIKETFITDSIRINNEDDEKNKEEVVDCGCFVYKFYFKN
jgi:hypothetical protein